MSPTLRSRERVIAVNPLKASFFRRGQIVTLRHLNVVPIEKYNYLHKSVVWKKEMEHAISEVFIKRIIGLPSDIIRISLREIPQHLTGPNVEIKSTEGYGIWHVPNDHVFVRGDNPNSVDSTIWGSIPISSLRQIVLCRFPSMRRIC